MSSATPAYLSDLIQTSVPFRPLQSSDARCWLSQEREASWLAGRFRSRPRAPGTHYHLTLDPALLWTLSNDTSKPTCSDILNLMPPAPLYLRTLRRYTNPILSVYLFTKGHHNMPKSPRVCISNKCILLYTVSQTSVHLFIFWLTVKNEPILMIFGTVREILRQFDIKAYKFAHPTCHL